jgi:hypothetical protein
MHAVSLTPHAQNNFRTTSKSENHMQNSDDSKKNEGSVNDTACTILRSKIDHSFFLPFPLSNEFINLKKGIFPT